MPEYGRIDQADRETFPPGRETFRMAGGGGTVFSVLGNATDFPTQ